MVVVRWMAHESCSEEAIDELELWMFERISSAILVSCRLPQGPTLMSDEDNNEMEGSDNDQSEFETTEEQNGEHVQSNIASMIHAFCRNQKSKACEAAFEDDSGNLDEAVETIEEQNGEYVQSNIASMIHAFYGIPKSEACKEAFEDDSGNLDETVETELMDDQGNPADHEHHINFAHMVNELLMLRQSLHDKKAAVDEIVARLTNCSHVLKIAPLVKTVFEFFFSFGTPS